MGNCSSHCSTITDSDDEESNIHYYEEVHPSQSQSYDIQNVIQVNNNTNSTITTPVQSIEMTPLKSKQNNTLENNPQELLSKSELDKRNFIDNMNNACAKYTDDLEGIADLVGMSNEVEMISVIRKQLQTLSWEQVIIKIADPSFQKQQSKDINTKLNQFIIEFIKICNKILEYKLIHESHNHINIAESTCKSTLPDSETELNPVSEEDSSLSSPKSPIPISTQDNTSMNIPVVQHKHNSLTQSMKPAPLSQLSEYTHTVSSPSDSSSSIKNRSLSISDVSLSLTNPPETGISSRKISPLDMHTPSVNSTTIDASTRAVLSSPLSIDSNSPQPIAKNTVMSPTSEATSVTLMPAPPTLSHSHNYSNGHVSHPRSILTAETNASVNGSVSQRSVVSPSHSISTTSITISQVSPHSTKRGIHMYARNSARNTSDVSIASDDETENKTLSLTVNPTSFEPNPSNASNYESNNKFEKDSVYISLSTLSPHMSQSNSCLLPFNSYDIAAHNIRLVKLILGCVSIYKEKYSDKYNVIMQQIHQESEKKMKARNRWKLIVNVQTVAHQLNTEEVHSVGIEDLDYEIDSYEPPRVDFEGTLGLTGKAKEQLLFYQQQSIWEEALIDIRREEKWFSVVHEGNKEDIPILEELIYSDPNRWYQEWDPRKLVNCVDNQHRSALYIAASLGHKEIVQFLLQNGANPQIMAIVGKEDELESPAEASARWCYVTILPLLILPKYLTKQIRDGLRKIAKRTKNYDIKQIIKSIEE